jgi:nicotinate-nucleotide--dimethylbenzimidazole phosphoribosyltransferase
LTFDIPAIANPALEQEVLSRWNSLTKPPGSLGRLEPAVTRLALQQGRLMPSIASKALYVFGADHGVTAEGISVYPSEVTRQMMLNFENGGAAINVLCRENGIRTVIVDCGVKGDPVAGTVQYRLGEGTRNFATEPAMTMDQTRQAIANGAHLAAGVEADIIAVGEMGIGNTTAASALLCAYTGLSAREATGPGTGLRPDGVWHKASVIAAALRLHAVPSGEPLRILATFGGFEIATMAGFLLGAANRRLPVMMDGFISCAAALAASRLDPAVRGFLHYAHQSAEPGHLHMLEHLDAQPLLDLGLRLGEGTGAALGLALLSQGVALYRSMATFVDAAVSNQS